MPLGILNIINRDDVLNEGRIKINNNMSNITAFVNGLEEDLAGLTPEDINGLLVGGKIDTQYLGTVISTAADVDVVDAAGNYSATDVEGVLAEIYTLINAVDTSSGASWYTGSDDPNVTDPSGSTLGDFYLRVNGSYYEKTGASAWTQRGTLSGPAGPAGPAGTDGTDGADGADGVGVPVGGTEGQVLIKDSSVDYDTSWSTPDTVTVVYNAGWPSARPNAVHVFAVGHTSAPSWLTSEDVWLEAV